MPAKRIEARARGLIALGLVCALGAAVVFLGLSSCRTAAPPVRLQKPAAPGAKPAPEDVKEHAATGFPLEGRHAELACEACHGTKEPKPACNTCHTPPHGPKFKKPCQSCHTAGHPFTEVKFRHADKGLFAFHKDIGCVQCHPTRQFTLASPNCTACHADYHKGATQPDCYVCHRSPAWVVNSFAHNSSGFPLMGAHRSLECGDCHRDLQSFRITPRPNSCAVCHESAYRSAPFPHAAYGAGKDCQECHLQDSWSYAHSPFWFNIQTGSMAGVDCSGCHKTSGNLRDYTCHDCHKGHAGDRNGRCMDCHVGGPPIKGVPAPGGVS